MDLKSSLGGQPFVRFMDREQRSRTVASSLSGLSRSQKDADGRLHYGFGGDFSVSSSWT